MVAIVVGAAGSPRAAPDGFVDIADVAAGIVVDARYAGSDNFMGRPARGYGAARCLLTKPAARALADAQRDVAAFGFGLMVYDCYRPQRAVDDFVAWARDAGAAQRDRSAAPSGRPEVRALPARVHRGAGPATAAGSTVDLTLIPAGPRQRAAAPVARLPCDCRAAGAGREPGHGDDVRLLRRALARGGRHGVPRRRGATALLLRTVMEKHGFVPYAQEWWHFTLASEPFPKTRFDFEIQRAP